MVWDPPRQEVNVTRMIIYSFIPILSIYAGWRIQKFWLLVVINIVIGFAISVPIQMVLPFPYGLGFSLVMGIIVSILVVKHFAEEYNKEILQKSDMNKDEKIEELEKRLEKIENDESKPENDSSSQDKTQQDSEPKS